MPKKSDSELPITADDAAPAPQVEAAAPSAAEDGPKRKLPRVGDFVPYTGDESNGRTEHPAIVTGVNDDDTINVTVFFDGSAPAARKGLVEDEDSGHFRVKEG